MALDRTQRALAIIHILRQATKGMVEPASVSVVKEYGADPFLILISCLLSLRTRDNVSLPASLRLFKLAKTPQQMLKLSIPLIEKTIFPVGFYHRKAEQIHFISQELINRFKGSVPSNFDELISIKGIGPKTANLVLGQAFGIPALCVDTHVHRISNRLGLVKTKTVEETEQQLKQVIPKHYWIEYNHLLVMWGQNICVPILPLCNECAIAPLCPRIGVKKHR